MAIPLIAAALSKEGAQAASSAINTVANVFMAKAQRKHQERLMKMQQEYQTKEREASQDWQRQMWRDQFVTTNAYNKPANLMRLYREAGLSPDMIYSGNSIQPAMMGSVPGSTASGAPSVPQVAGSENLAQAGQGLADTALKIAQIKNLEGDTKEKESNTRLNDSITLLNGLEIPISKQKLKIGEKQLEEMEQNIRTGQASVNKFNQQVRESQSRQALNEQQLKEMASSFDQRMSSYYINNQEALSRIGISQKIFDHYTEEIKARIEGYKAAARKDNAVARQMDLDYIASSIQFNAERDFERSLGKHEGYVYRRLLEFNHAMMTNNEALLSKQLDLFQTYGEAQQWIDMITQILGSLVSGASTAATVKEANANADFTNSQHAYYKKWHSY